MNLNPSKEHICLFLKCLHEEVTDTNINSYTISDLWWAESDIDFLNKLVEQKYIQLENQTISFTEKGRDFMDKLYPDREVVPPNKVMTYVRNEIKRILKCLENEL